MALRSGETLRNRYQIESVLGQGGMGAVYRAKDLNLRVPVAVKENLFTTEEYARQFHNEATILAGLRHANLPRVIDHFVLPGEGQYLVMDFIEGTDLRERIERDGPVRVEDGLPWFLQVCDALAYLHSRRPYPILHRDIKPGNIKIQPDGRAILVDFGLAKVVDESGTTTTGAKAMTPGFSPPEQYGTGRTDPRTDIYALGATMYACLTAEIPEDSLERAMGRDELTPLRRRRPDITPSLARAIEKALSVRPEERYQSMAEFAAALGSASEAGGPTMVREFPYLDQTLRAPLNSGLADLPTRLPWEPEADRRWLKIGAGAVGLLLLVGAALAVPRLSAGLAGLEGTDTPGVEPTPTGSQPTDSPTAQPTVAGATAALILITATPPGGESTPSSALTLTPLPTPVGGGVGQIAFASDRSGTPQIYLMNVDGTGLKALTSMPEGACQPSWSPDGKSLAFISPCLESREDYPGAGLWVLELENLEPRPLLSAPGGDYDPAWSPGGDRIAFASEREGRPQIYIMGLDGDQLLHVHDFFAPEVQPSWSPADNLLLFVSYRNRVAQLWSMSDTGENPLRFARGDREDSHPAWSSDGQQILFQRKVGGIPRLFAAGFADHGVPDFQVCQQAPYSAHPMAEPDYSPDGRWLVFEYWPDGINHNISIMTASCTIITNLTTEAALDFDPAWRP